MQNGFQIEVEQGWMLTAYMAGSTDIFSIKRLKPFKPKVMRAMPWWLYLGKRQRGSSVLGKWVHWFLLVGLDLSLDLYFQNMDQETVLCRRLV
jgi:hypothetical protein